ncbi:MAG: hypothetical protein ABUL61_02395, partial [Oleiharenicola lentus]
MKLLTKRSLNSRMLISIGFAVFAGLAALTTAVSVRAMRSARADAFTLSRKTADEIAARMEGRLGSAIGTARTLSQAFGQWASTGKPDRVDADAMLRGALEAAPDYIGVWTLWEP